MSALHNNDIAITLILCKSVKKWAMSTRLKRNAELKQNISGLVEGNTKPDNSPGKRGYWKLAVKRETIKCSRHQPSQVPICFWQLGNLANTNSAGISSSNVIH